MSQPSFDLDVDPTDTYRVSELATAIGAAVRRGFPAEVWVRGEIDSLSRSAAGHVYFDLVEGVGNERVALRVALFRATAEAVERHLARHRMRLENGLEIRIMGRVELYEARGQVNLRMSGIDPTYTLGRLAQDRDRLIRALTAEGLLERNRRHVLPAVPLRLGMVTSRDTAAYADFMHELEASGFAWQVLVADSRVQGADAVESVGRALAALARCPVDVVVVIRGGGSRNELAVFDAESIARAIAAMPVPVLTGIGHEVDRAIADLVAHTSLKTPTACAAHLIDVVSASLAVLDRSAISIARAARVALDRSEQTVSHRAALVQRDVNRALDAAAHSVQTAAERAGRSAATHLHAAGQRVDRTAARVAARSPAALLAADRHIDSVAARVKALDPARVLERGYSITRDERGAVVRTAAAVPIGDRIVTTVADGEIVSEVVR
ncbi:MAG TPA: exodeoxyribonuclease VII large subunit [Acidimicrobiales bacterium]|nr:exodeoxyribonuclease VII large subunit [Acidimicrobiales bacterium]